LSETPPVYDGLRGITNRYDHFILDIWGVLHDGRLVHYDDFEVAYADFKELIGWKPPPGWPQIPVATA